jgi:hypothetical protein
MLLTVATYLLLAITTNPEEDFKETIEVCASKGALDDREPEVGLKGLWGNEYITLHKSLGKQGCGILPDHLLPHRVGEVRRYLLITEPLMEDDVAFMLHSKYKGGGLRLGVKRINLFPNHEAPASFEIIRKENSFEVH